MAVELGSWEDLNIAPEILREVANIGWSNPTPIQSKSIPAALDDKSIVGVSDTGSGKTGAFAIPIIQKLLERSVQEESLSHQLYCLVLVPTRELAAQIAEEFMKLGRSINLRVCSLFGGESLVLQAKELSKRPHVIISSPGRLIDHLTNTKGFHLKSVKYLVLDEADRLMEMEFEEAIANIMKYLPKKHRIFLFSATFNQKIEKIQSRIIGDVVNLTVNASNEVVSALRQYMILVPAKRKFIYLAAYLENHLKRTMIIFVNTCKMALKLTSYIHHLGHKSIGLHGKLKQAQRSKCLSQVKNRSRNILVTTDVSARGIDINNIDVVMNFDVANSPKDHIHRVGRTARAGKKGEAITILTQYDVEAFLAIEQYTNTKMEEYDGITDEMMRNVEDRALTAYAACESEKKSFEVIVHKKKKK